MTDKARLENGQEIFAKGARGRTCYCRTCFCELMLRDGAIREAHFAHYNAGNEGEDPNCVERETEPPGISWTDG